MKSNTRFLLLLIVSFLGVQITSAQGLTVDKIVEKTYEVYKYYGDDRINMVNMDIKNKSGKLIMNREFVLFRKNESKGLNQKWYAYFKKPADIRKMIFMVWKNEDKDDNRWIYLPAMDLVKRLAGSDKRSSFAGSQFVYEDVTGRLPKSDTHELVTSDDTYYEIKSTPKDPSSVEFSYFYTWVEKGTFIPMKRVFYDRNGEKHREYLVEEIKTIQGFKTATKFTMTNLQTGESTYTTFSDVRYNVGIPDNVFTEAYLRRVPRKWVTYNQK